MFDFPLTVSVSHCRRGSAGALTSDCARVEMFSRLERYSNFKNIDFSGVSSVAVDDVNNIIFQVSGYTFSRGAFCDLY